MIRKTLFASALALTALAPSTLADGRNPGSVLVYTIHRSGGAFFTIASVTNTNTTPAAFGMAGGTTNAHFEYVNTLPNAQNPFLPLDCYVVDRLETLTPADTLSVLTSCHNAASAEGYLVVTATSIYTGAGKDPWLHNYLAGSEMVVTALGGIYSVNAIPFDALQHVCAAPTALNDDEGCAHELAAGPSGQLTDLDGDGQLDFDGMEYEGIADELYLDNFLAVAGSSLTLINMTGGTRFDALVQFDIWNDNEQPLSATRVFRCWFEESLETVSDVFSESYLANNTPHDPSEVDINCDGVGDLEAGWARIVGTSASSSATTIPNAALLGAITAGPLGNINGARLLWEDSDKQFNGDFLHFGVDAPPDVNQ